MIYKLLFILISVVTSLNSFSQPSSEKYFDYVHKAEYEITQNNYSKALRFYRKAFKVHEESFNLDLRNSFICSCKLNRKKEIEKYYILLKQRLIDVSKLKLKCKQIANNFNWKELEDKEILITLDTIYMEELNSLLYRDQSIRNYIFSNGGNYESDKDTIAYIDSLNLTDLKLLIKKRGFPTERVVGSLKAIELIVLHNHQWGRNDLNNLLYEKSIEGEYSPYSYAYLHESWKGDYQTLTYRIENANIINEQLYFDYWTKQSSAIDSLRKELYIESLKVQREKILSNKISEGFLFHGYLIAIFNGNGEFEKKIINSLLESKAEYEKYKLKDNKQKKLKEY